MSPEHKLANANLFDKDPVFVGCSISWAMYFVSVWKGNKLVLIRGYFRNHIQVTQINRRAVIIFPLLHNTHTTWKARTTFYPSSTRGSYSEAKQFVQEVDHGCTPSAEIRNAWSYTSICRSSTGQGRREGVRAPLIRNIKKTKQRTLVLKMASGRMYRQHDITLPIYNWCCRKRQKHKQHIRAPNPFPDRWAPVIFTCPPPRPVGIDTCMILNGEYKWLYHYHFRSPCDRILFIINARRLNEF